ncbi:10425_t:CDS:2 [Diversispora eburnea]|uniref:10425_t:CDS:1 n=1 Tax=Diversispora eburnea TaxID=1213867 RepID=A0A9N8YMJ5_9GLOM|nr:10425_t:CDS:2 [Diversispora eburnea]
MSSHENINNNTNSSTSLPIECWQEILKNLENDKKSLHSFLLVNRTCLSEYFENFDINMMDLNEFDRNGYEIGTTYAGLIKYMSNLSNDMLKCGEPYFESNKNYFRERRLIFLQRRLIQTYLKFLNEEERQVLINHGILTDLKTAKNFISNFDDSKISSKLFFFRYPPIFDYPNYLRELPYNLLCESIESWLWSFRETCQSDKSLIVAQELCKLFMRKSKWINSLSFTYYVPSNECFFSSIKDFLFLTEFDGAERCLHSLKNLKFAFHSDQWRPIMMKMAKICNQVESLDIRCIGESHKRWLDESAKSIIKFIEIQNELKHIKVNCCGNYCPLTRIIPSLIVHVKSLEYIEFVHINFNGGSILKFIADCQNLKTLIFRDCIDFNFFDFTPPIGALWLQNVTKLVFVDTTLEPNDILPIIGLCKKLFELCFDLGDDIEYLGLFGQYMPENLKHLTIDATGIEISTLEEFLICNKAKNLESLRFTAWICRNFTDQHLSIITQHLGKSLKQLDLHLNDAHGQGGISWEGIQMAQSIIEVVTTEGEYEYDTW